MCFGFIWYMLLFVKDGGWDDMNVYNFLVIYFFFINI